MLDRADIAIVVAKKLEEALDAPPRDVWNHSIRTTSGTSGAPIVSLFRHHPGNEIYLESSRLLAISGALNFRLGNVALTQDLSQKAHILTVGIAEEFDEMTALIDDFAPDCVRGTPSTVVRFKYLSEKARQAVRLLALGGERISAASYEALRTKFPNARINIFYIANELGPIGNPACAPFPVNFYHPALGVSVEIFEPDEMGVGELLISRKGSGLQIDQYRIGDKGRVVTTPCACGAMTFEVLGRTGYDFIKLAGAVVRQDEVARVCAQFPQLIHDYRAEVSEQVTGGTVVGSMRLRVFNRMQVSDALRLQLEEAISAALYLSPTHTLADLVEKGNFMPLSIEFSPEPFPKKDKDIKITVA